MKRIEVVAAIIWNTSATELLISLRPSGRHQGNLWEFPGGKRESSESALTALSRELHEEVNIRPTRAAPFVRVDYDYPSESISLDVWQVFEYDGEPIGRESQQIRWVGPAELNQLAFPAANQPVIELLRRTIKDLPDSV